jgi:hypothetical protein
MSPHFTFRILLCVVHYIIHTYMEIVPYSFQFNTPAEECKYWGINSHLNMSYDPGKSTLTRLSLTNLAGVFMLFWLSVLFRSFWKNWSFFRWRMNTRISAHDCPRITNIRIATKTQFCCQRSPRYCSNFGT